MASKSFSSVDGLKEEINKRINKSLNNEIAEYVESKLKDHIDKDVYSTYTPVLYDRRKEDGGLMDEANIRKTVRSQELNVYEEAPLEGPRLRGSQFWNKDGLSKLIENGAHNPWNRKRYRWTKPRPFVTNTQKDINYRYSKIIKMLKERIEHDT